MRTHFLLLALLLAGCPYDPYTAVYTTNKPAAADLVGVYTPDAKTRTLIAERGHYKNLEPSITLQADGTVILKDIPDWWLTPFGEPKGGVDSGQGTWTIRKHQDWWSVSAQFTDSKGFASQAPAGAGLSTGFMLIGEKAPYKIHLTIGDPDEGLGMQFERAP